MEGLPCDVVISIILLCPSNDILRLTCVNKHLNSITDSLLWKKKLAHEYPSFYDKLSIISSFSLNINDKLLDGRLSYKLLVLLFDRGNAKVITMSNYSNPNSVEDVLIRRSDSLYSIMQDIFRIYNVECEADIDELYFRITGDISTSACNPCNILNKYYRLDTLDNIADNDNLVDFSLSFDDTKGIFLSNLVMYRIRLFIDRDDPLMSYDDIDYNKEESKSLGSFPFIDMWFGNNTLLSSSIDRILSIEEKAMCIISKSEGKRVIVKILKMNPNPPIQMFYTGCDLNKLAGILKLRK